MATLLVTGGAGFIGANLVHYWLRQHPGDRVVVLDALTYAGNLANLEPISAHEQFRFVEGSILRKEAVTALMREERIDTVVHFAAESHVDRSLAGPEAFVETNVVGTHSLLQAARVLWLDSDDAPPDHRFHHISTDEVYGSLGPSDPGFTESSPYAPSSPYAASKAAADHLVRAYHQSYGLQVTTSNCSNNYGPYQFPEKLIPLMIVNVLTGKPLPVYGDGSNIRDWLHVEDHVRAIDLVIRQGKVGETYNIGGDEERANMDIVKMVCQRIDALFAADPGLAKRFPDAPAARGTPSESLIRMVKDRPAHDWRYAIDASKAKTQLGFSTGYNFDTGLDQTVAWMLDNERWWRAVMDGNYRDWVSSHYGD